MGHEANGMTAFAAPPSNDAFWRHRTGSSASNCVVLAGPGADAVAILPQRISALSAA
jgi:hypothetical protein